ncbi:MAG: hypothetical protein JEZ05_08365 [Tenericutes bacterium]|nr:hypothetical protein [Mycoplasmatota bacterium]
MNNTIERYVYDVVRRLPANQRAEVSLELESNIREMLRDEPTEQEIEEVLQSLGHPRTLASDYRGNKKYLVGPEWFDDYITVLKIVAIVFGAIALVSGGITHALNPDSETIFGIIFEILGKTLGDIIDSLFQAFAVVTFIFIIVDRANKDGRVMKFETKNLPNLPDKTKKNISRLGTFISLIVNLTIGSLFIYLLYKNMVSIIWIDGGIVNNTLPLFNPSIVQTFVPIFIAVLLLNVSSDIFKLLKGQWTASVTALHLAARVMQAIVTVLFITQASLLNPDFVQEIATFFDVSVNSLLENIHIVIIIFAILISVGAFAEIISVLFKTLKHKIPVEMFKDELKKERK